MGAEVYVNARDGGVRGHQVRSVYVLVKGRFFGRGGNARPPAYGRCTRVCWVVCGSTKLGARVIKG